MYATPETITSILRNPASLAAILQELQQEQELRKKAEQERLWIGTKREATAMATASVAVRKLEKIKEKVQILNEELGQTAKGATILKVAKTLGVSEKEFNWRKLKNASIAAGDEIKRIEDPRFGYANVYSVKAWWTAYNIDLEEIFSHENLS